VHGDAAARTNGSCGDPRRDAGVPKGFRCPLNAGFLTTACAPYPSRAAANAAVARFRSCADPRARGRLASELFLRHGHLVRRTLRRFCARSRCYPGGCLVEDLVGAAYPVFRRVLEEYDAAAGLDFVGYASQRLYWGLEHVHRRLERERRRASGIAGAAGAFAPSGERPGSDGAPERIEDRLLDRIVTQRLLAALRPEDRWLLTRHVAGYTYEELAPALAATPAALRKRVQRLLARLRRLADPGANGGSPRAAAREATAPRPPALRAKVLLDLSSPAPTSAAARSPRR
jgi:RNA polymerase sigma factor (sigma-70 family)